MGTTVLLLLDLQNGVIDLLKNSDPTNTESYLQLLSPTISAARATSIKIIHIMTAFRPGYPDGHPHNTSVHGAALNKMFMEGDDSVGIHPAVDATSTEPVITKRRVSAFFGTELEMILRYWHTERIVVAGLITSGAVLSTIRQAQDLDFKITVLRDLCMDRDEEVHRVLVDKVFARKMEVVHAKEWVRLITELGHS